MFKSVGPMELIILLVIVVIFFGVGKLPQVGEGIGKAIRSFKKAQAGEDEEPPVEMKAEATAKSATKKTTSGTKTNKKTV